MPILLDPDQTYPIVLNVDKDKPNPPTFRAKAQSMRSHIQVAAVLDSWAETKDTLKVEDVYNQTIDILSGVVVGWSNMVDPKTSKDIPFTTDAFRDVLTYNEARELISKCVYNMHLSADEKKTSESSP